jgi:hypothetical protein
MDYAIHPKTGKKQEIHSCYPRPRQDSEDHDCLFCVNADTCEKRNGIFFVGERYKPCKRYVGLRERNFETWKKLEEEREEREVVKKIFTPTPRPPESKKDCLFCKKLIRHHRLGLPRQGDGEVCSEYSEINIRPEDEAQHCIYCLINFKCEYKRIVRDGQPCGKYVEYVPGNTEQTAH